MKNVARHGPIGSLLEEISWEGNARHYRQGGRGFENVLTCEVFQALDLLPRKHFFGAILAHVEGGSDETRSKLQREVEKAEFSFLPGRLFLGHKRYTGHDDLMIHPDVTIETPNTYTVVEAKRIRRSSFQTEQLARSFVTALKLGRTRKRFLLLVLPKAPPVSVQSKGRISISKAITGQLDKVLPRVERFNLDGQAVEALIEETVCWITWSKIGAVVKDQAESFRTSNQSVKNSIVRLADSICGAIAWHS